MRLSINDFQRLLIDFDFSQSWSLLLIVVMISSGLFLFTYKSTEFDLLGFILLLIASFSSGARWTLAQILMQKSKLGLHNPIGEY